MVGVSEFGVEKAETIGIAETTVKAKAMLGRSLDDDQDDGRRTFMAYIIYEWYFWK